VFNSAYLDVANGNIRGCRWQHQGLPLATSGVANGNIRCCHWQLEQKEVNKHESEQNESTRPNNNKGRSPSVVAVIFCNLLFCLSQKQLPH